MSHQDTERSSRKVWAYAICGLLLALAALLLFVKKAYADTISYDAYADAVAGSTPVVTNANNAVGGPNGTLATLVGVGASVTLDMGQGEEGTQTLKAYLGQLGAQVNMRVEFLDENKAVIASETRQLGASLGASTQNFAYNWTSFGKAYRYVKVSSMAGGGVNLDAVEALGYLGSTASQDTDGDGVPDRQEQANGTNPLVPDAPAGSATPPRTTRPGGSSTGASGQVNPPPAGTNDQDGDGMPDAWENANGLDPNDKNDASGDPDHDELVNLTEYQIGSDPQKYDTDGDGMPDGWEYQNGLDVTTNDADGDPDGDFLTNLGEYRHHTDPNKADDLYKVFGTECKTTSGLNVWDWVVFALLLAGALVAWAAAFKNWAGTRKS